MENILKVFIAGSKALADERDAVAASLIKVANQSNGNISYEVKSFEDFDSYLNEGGRQAEYNEWIIKADFVIFILNHQVGGITKNEFLTAIKAFMLKGTPEIFVYSNAGKSISYALSKLIKSPVDEIKRMISSQNQYYTEYYGIDGLRKCVFKDFVKFNQEIAFEKWISDRTVRINSKKEEQATLTELESSLTNIMHQIASLDIQQKQLNDQINAIREKLYIIDPSPKDESIKTNNKVLCRIQQLKHITFKTWLVIVILSLVIAALFIIPKNNAVSPENSSKAVSIYDSKPVNVLRTIKIKDRIIRVEEIEQNSFRYLSWDIDSIIANRNKPSLVLVNGIKKEQDYVFMNGNYKYIVPLTATRLKVAIVKNGEDSVVHTFDIENNNFSEKVCNLDF